MTGQEMRQGSSTRNVVLASPDAALRQRLRSSLSGMRWNVREAAGGAEAVAAMEDFRPEALVLDSWLPDLEAGAFAGQVQIMFPGVDLLTIDGGTVEGGFRSPRRNELLHALREAQDGAPVDEAIWRTAPIAVPEKRAQPSHSAQPFHSAQPERSAQPESSIVTSQLDFGNEEEAFVRPDRFPQATPMYSFEGLVGRAACMQELARMVRLVAPRMATVLIEGETGTGKEVVAKAVHRLSARAAKPFVVLNCAAIPEALLEAELFGHTRGAFTGAVQSRTGRIEAAHGGTLFLDEIGEMPLALQAKMLRFLECGELQKVGDNDAVRVDVRVIAATHQPLEQRACEGTFRLDLYHRLAVFPLQVPTLRERPEDLPMLVEHFLAQMGLEQPRKKIVPAAMERLLAHSWPGNVRELAHVLERAAILAGDAAEIGESCVRLRSRERLTSAVMFEGAP